MNVLSSTSAFLLNLNAQGLFSSQTAFQRPRVSNSLKTASQSNSKLIPTQSVGNPVNKSYKPIQITLKNEDPDLVMCEPVKKVKITQDQPEMVNLLKNTRKEMQQKPSKLTIEMVFDAQTKTKNTQPNNFFDEDANEGSSLSFISSYTSIDSLEAVDEEVVEVQKKENNDYEIMDDAKDDTAELVMEPLVVKDSVVSHHLNYLNPGNYFTPSLMNYPVVFPYSQYNAFESASPFQNEIMTYDDSLNNVSNINQYIQPIQAMMNFPQIRASNFLQNPENFLTEEKNISDHLNKQFENIRAKTTEPEEEGYDSDSYATRSTGLDANQDGIDKSQKSASPLYSVNEDMPVEEKIQIISLEAPKKKKRGRKPKHTVQQGLEEVDSNGKGKKGRTLNLQIDINPKHLKVERRLNKLQLLRYQQEAPEGEYEEYIKRVGDIDSLSRNNSLFNETNDSQSTTTSEGKINAPELKTYENTLAIIPPLNFEPSIKRSNLLTVWSSKDISEEELECYFHQLGEIVEFPVTDQEKGLKLLKTFNMNIAAALEAVKGNKTIYSELLKIKVKRLRRR